MMVRSSDVPPMMVSGTRATPRLKRQRLRARIWEMKRLTFPLGSLGNYADQGFLEVMAGQRVPVFREKGVGQLEAGAVEVGIDDQHGVESGDRLVEQRVAAVVVHLSVGLLDGGHTVVEQDIKVLGGGEKGE